MNITLSRDELQELLQLLCIGSHVRNAVFQAQGVYSPDTDDLLIKELRTAAFEHGCEEVEEDFDGAISFTPLFELMCHSLIEQYEEEQFWNELENRTHVRDLERTSGCGC